MRDMFGVLRVKGINGTAKREEVVEIFKERKFKLLALMDTRLKGKEDVSWYGVNGIIASIQMERAREQVNDRLGEE